MPRVASWPRGARRHRAALLGLAMLGAGCVGLPSSPPETLPLYASAPVRAALFAGAAAVDVTPSGSVFLAGYHPWRRSRGVHDPIYARAIVLESGPLRLALVSVDVVGLQRDDVARWHERFERVGFDPRHVIVHATHNHSGPDTLGLWGLPPFLSGQDDAYMERLGEGIVQALLQARDTLRPAELVANAVSIDPRGVMKNLRRPGLVDRELVVVHVREPGGGSTIATWVELGCHPEVLGPENRLLTADFPAWTVRTLEERLGGVGLYVSGALGGLVTPDVEQGFPEGAGGSFEDAERLGRRVAELALDALEKHDVAYQREPRIVARQASMVLRNRNFRYRLVRWTGVLDRKMYRGGYLLTGVSLWEIGSLRVATVPGEITPDLGLRIKRAVGGDPTLLVGLGNDELGYLMPEADFELPIYDYERTVSPGAEGGDRLLRLFEDLRFLVDADRDVGGSSP